MIIFLRKTYLRSCLNFQLFNNFNSRDYTPCLFFSLKTHYERRTKTDFQLHLKPLPACTKSESWLLIFKPDDV